MTRHGSNRFRARPIQGVVPADGEGGAALLGPAEVLAALRLVRRGEVYDLDAGRWPGMTIFPSAPPFQVVTYRSPSGLRADRSYPDWTDSGSRFGWIDELVLGSMHSGTHVDALSHVTVGSDDHWYGGHTAGEHLGNFGPLGADGASIPPIVTRGVLVDVSRYRGGGPLPAAYSITVEDLEGSLAQQGIEVGTGDCVLVRTGFMQVWQTEDASRHQGAGVGLGAGRWLADHGIVALGVDNDNVEALPSGDADNPHPLHVEFLVERGLYLIEALYLEELARDAVYEFLFVCAPPRIKGTSGGLARPLAVA